MNDFLHECIAFAPHPDDAELWCGGLLASLAHKGYRTGIVDLTLGEMSTRGTVEERQKEVQAASHILKLATRENLKIPDCGIPMSGNLHDGKDAVALIADSIRRLKPELVVVPFPDGRHPDHDATPHLLQQALFLAALRKFTASNAQPHTVRQVLFYQLRGEFKPSFYVDISAHFATKLAAIKCFQSQTATSATGPKTLVSSALNLPSIEARDRHLGAAIGVEYAEGYLVRNALPLQDPVAHFRQHDLRGALFFPGM